MTDVVLVDDETDVADAHAQTLELAAMSVVTVNSATEALRIFEREAPLVVVTDIRMPGIDGFGLMTRLHELDRELPVILITGHGDVPLAVEAMRAGAYDFLEKPFDTGQLVSTVERAIAMRRLVLENRRLRARLDEASGLEQMFIGVSEAARGVRSAIVGFADVGADVLVLGETGSGKEVVARNLHGLSSRANGPFVAINCGALPDTLIESELFGHEPGAFTGASKTRVGRIEYASGGTLFLDEIESMPLDVQVRILRTLQDRKICRLGSNREIAVDVRVVAATKVDLADEVAAGRFRKDLLYRLDVLRIEIPPLRERREDIALLFQHFLDGAASRLKRKAPRFDADILAAIIGYDWPGNVRELQNAAMRHCLGQPPIPETGASQSREGVGEAGRLAAAVAAFERQLIQQALTDHGGRMRPTYEALGVSRKTLYDKLRRHGITGLDDD